MTVNSENAIEGLSRHELLSQLKKRFDAIKSYQCRMRLEGYEKEYQLQNQKFWYKKPGYMRIEQTGPFRKGAVVVIHPDGTIRGHLGGLLSFLNVTLKPDDPRLFGVTNDSALTADYGSIIQSALQASPHVKHYNILRGSEDGKSIIILESYVDEEIDLYRLVIDSERMLIIRLERYKGSKLIFIVSWEDIQLDIELSDEIFQL